MTETLKGGQKKIDKNHNGKIDAEDFKILRGEKKGMKEEAEEVSEVSKDLLKKAAGKAEADYAAGAKKGGDIYTDKQMKKRNDQSWKFRIAASQKEEVEHVEEEQIDEVSKDTLQKYIRKASTDAANHAYTAGTGEIGRAHV